MQLLDCQNFFSYNLKKFKNSKVFNQRYLFFMSLPFIVWILIFSFGPMFGWVMAFQDFNPSKGILGSPWVGLKHFALLFESKEALLVVGNTVVISFLSIIAGNILPMFLALSINELSNKALKRTIQTISYLPYFVSYVVVANIFLSIFSYDGVVNDILLELGFIDKRILVWADKDKFWGMVTFVNVWKELGWRSIIYLAAIASIDTQIYEAAMLDGCGRIKRIFHITIPSILHIVVLLWILSMGDIFKAGFDFSYLLGNSATREVSEVIDTYVFRLGMESGMYSFSTAVSLLKVLLGSVMVIITNKIARKYTEYSLW